MNNKTMKEFLDIYNSLTILYEQSYITREEFLEKINVLAHNVMGRFALIVNKSKEKFE